MASAGTGGAGLSRSRNPGGSGISQSGPSNAPARGGGGRGRGRGRPWFRPQFGNRQNEPPREKPVAVAIPSSRGEPEEPPVGRRSVAQFAVAQPEKYPDWRIYLPQEAYMDGSANAIKVAAFERHIENSGDHYNLARIMREAHFDVSLDVLKEDSTFHNRWSTFDNDLLTEPENTLACLGIAMHHMILALDQAIQCLHIISPRIVGFGPVVHLKTLKVSSCGKMICFKGTVTRLGPSEILFTWLTFKCPNCGSSQIVRQPDGRMTHPKSCKGRACRTASGFQQDSSSVFTRCEIVQKILVEESIQDRNRDALRTPRSIEVELSNDLVDSIYPGDDVTITGVLKMRSDEERKDKAKAFTSYIRAVNLSSNSNPVIAKAVEFTEKSLRAIELIKTDSFPLRLLTHSLCPEIKGHEMLKAGLVLGLFSGNFTNKSDFRSEVHVLMVGDPGLGKSCILKACASAAPRGIFTSCSSSSRTGLTATVKMEKGEGATLEAGALVLADQGVCCIDEFDKVATNHASMLEVMEQQSVSVAKAGVLCTLPARTTILAAGNPTSGHYDRSKTVSENLKLQPAILSRFDLVFILLDHQGKDFDTLFSEFTGRSRSSISAPNKPLLKRLQLRPGENIDVLPHVLFQKYIAYAQKYVKVRLTEEAAKLLQRFYLELRQIRLGNQCIPVTIRQFEALMRMTLARARLDLSESAEIHHAMEVIELVKHSMMHVLSPDGGDTIDWQRGMNGSGMSKASQARKFLAEIQTRSFQKQKREFHIDEFKAVANKLAMIDILRDILDSLNIQGYILNRGNGFYHLL